MERKRDARCSMHKMFLCAYNNFQPDDDILGWLLLNNHIKRNVVHGGACLIGHSISQIVVGVCDIIYFIIMELLIEVLYTSIKNSKQHMLSWL
jgi:hypothetical protein